MPPLFAVLKESLVNHYRHNITRDCGLHASVFKKSEHSSKKFGNNFPRRLLHAWTSSWSHKIWITANNCWKYPIASELILC